MYSRHRCTRRSRVNQRHGIDTRVESDGDDIVLTITPTTDVLRQYTGADSTTVRAKVIGPRTIGVPASGGNPATPLAFAVGEAESQPEYLFSGGRLSRRIA